MNRILMQPRKKTLGMLMVLELDMKSFARDRGYQHETVRQAVKRYAGKGAEGRSPREGTLTWKILQDLENVLFEEVDHEAPTGPEPEQSAAGGR